MKNSNGHARLIVNPAAGRNATSKKWPAISALLRKIGLSFDHRFTEGTGHAIVLAKEAADNGYRYVVAVGGDGTVHEVANGILNSASPQEMAMGIISTGTGSDFNRSAGIPRKHLDSCSYLTSPRRLLIDIGTVEYRKNGKAEKRYFVNAAGVGFDAAVVEATESVPKYFGGTVPYVMGLLRTLIGYRNKPVVLRIGDRTESARVLSIVVANGAYVGGGMNIAPLAKLNDNLLDVLVIGDVGKLELLQTFPRVYRGTHLTHPKVRLEKVTSISAASAERLLVYADGELLGEGPASFNIIPSALNIVV
jgi:diacylglycerol kinase (ATP)